jgi:hypothetical protein
MYTLDKFQDGGSNENPQSLIAVRFRVNTSQKSELWATCSVLLQYKRLYVTAFYLKSKGYNTSFICNIIILPALLYGSVWQKFVMLIFGFKLEWVSIAMGYGLDSRVSIPFRGNFIHPKACRLDLSTTQPPLQWIPGTLSPGIKGPGREADHSPASSAEIKNDEAIPALPLMSSWHKI